MKKMTSLHAGDERKQREGMREEIEAWNAKIKEKGALEEARKKSRTRKR